MVVEDSSPVLLPVEVPEKLVADNRPEKVAPDNLAKEDEADIKRGSASV